MYEAYWKLTDNPFASRAAGEPFFPSETHQAALLKIRYVIEHRKGTAAVIGARGVGKTFLARTLSTQLAATGPFVHITYPQMTPHELLAYLGRQWGVESLHTTEPLSTDRLIAELQQAFAQHEKAGKHPVILVDDGLATGAIASAPAMSAKPAILLRYCVMIPRVILCMVMVSLRTR